MKRIISDPAVIALLASPAWAGWAVAATAYKRYDYATALREFRPPAAQGSASAQFNLGFMHHQGRGVLEDYAEALSWYRKAAQQGHALAQSNLGLMYAEGQGVPQDYVYAHMWFNLAAALGHKNGTKGRDIIAKKMTPADISKAQKLAREWRAKHGKK